MHCSGWASGAASQPRSRRLSGRTSRRHLLHCPLVGCAQHGLDWLHDVASSVQGCVASHCTPIPTSPPSPAFACTADMSPISEEEPTSSSPAVPTPACPAFEAARESPVAPEHRGPDNSSPAAASAPVRDGGQTPTTGPAEAASIVSLQQELAAKLSLADGEQAASAAPGGIAPAADAQQPGSARPAEQATAQQDASPDPATSPTAELTPLEHLLTMCGQEVRRLPLLVLFKCGFLALTPQSPAACGQLLA